MRAPTGDKLAGLLDQIVARLMKLRSAFVPDVVQPASKPAHEHTHAQAARMSWARLLKRVFDIDVERWA